MSSDFRDFIIWERESKDTIDFKKIYVDMVGDLKAGLMLSQMVYWRLPRKERSEEDSRLTIERDGRKWLAKSDKDWWGEIRLSDKEARSARLVLEKRGLVEFRIWKFAGTPTVHSSINEERFMELWNQMRATALEERQAGRVEPKTKRELYRKPGSKPRSGNWRKNQPPEEGAETDPEVPAWPLRVEFGNYEKRNLEITKSVISELPKGQNGNYPKGKMGITQSVISYTESTAETTAEIPSETPTGGEYELTGDARARDERAPVTGPADAALTTTGAPLNRKGETSEPPADLPGQAPGGAAAHAAGEANAGPDQDSAEPPGGKTDRATFSENVPGAAPAAAGHDPEKTREVLAPALGGVKKLASLMKEMPPGLRAGSREAWITAITPERAAELITRARAQQGVHPWTAIAQLLDQEIGARIEKGGARGVETVVVNAGQVPRDEPVPDRPAENALDIGSRWEHKHVEDKICTIVDIHGGKIIFHNGEEILALDLVRQYKRVD